VKLEKSPQQVSQGQKFFKEHEEWPDPDLNWGHKDFQSSALPTELSSRFVKTFIKSFLIMAVKRFFLKNLPECRRLCSPGLIFFPQTEIKLWCPFRKIVELDAG
jgi:hypothetical protein